MELYSRSFARSLRRRALGVIKSQPDLRKEYKARRQRMYGQKNRLVLTLYFFVVCGMLLARSRDSAQLPYIFIAAYGTGTIFLRVIAFTNRLIHGAESMIFTGLPIPDREFFDLQWIKFLRNTFWPFLLVSAAYCTLIDMHSFATNAGFSLLCALAQWGMIVSIGLILLNTRKKFLVWVALLLYACVPLSLFLPVEFAQYFYSITFLLPAGWVNHAHALLLAGDNTGFIWLLPSVVFGVIGFFLLPKLRNSYQLQPLGNMILSPGENFSAADDNKTSSKSISEAAATHVKQRLFESPDWVRQGWLERIASAWLTHNEKALAEFMMGGRVGKWSAAWKKTFYITLIGGVIVQFVPGVPLWFGTVIVLASAMFGAPIIGGNWLGFHAIRLGVKTSFVAALYPVDYWGVSKVILKINVVRLLAWSVMFLPLTTLLGIRFGLELQQAEFLAVRIFLLLLVLQFPVIAGLHSTGTNDTRTFTLRSAVLVTIASIYMIGLLAAGGALCVPDAPVAWAIAAATFVPGSALVWWLYGLFYSRKRVDLVHEPKEG